MKPLAALNLPPENKHTIEVFKAVNSALNDIDRAMYPPVDTLHERHDAIIAAYKDVGERFAAQAEAAGVSNWLQAIILNRTFALVYDDDDLDRSRAIFKEMERLGYPGVIMLVCTRIIWADVLAERGAADEARSVARLLLDDLPALRARYPQFLPTDLDENIERFRKRIGI
jgi:hypothetical protein